MTRVFDSSALLAAIFNEPGGDVVAGLWAEGDNQVSSVNYAEVVSKLSKRGMPDADIITMMEGVPLTLVAFDQATAHACGLLCASTRHLGLSLGDRACIALAQSREATVVTADQQWAKVLELELRLVR